MIHYTIIESQDYGVLMFKVIGAPSKAAAQASTIRNWNLNDRLKQGITLDGSPTICPLFSDLKGDLPYNS